MNFPELSLLEPLAAALGTTVSELLGMEDASQVAILGAAVEMHKKENAKLRQKLKIIGWLLIGLGFVVFLHAATGQEKFFSALTPEGQFSIWR